MIAHAEPEPQGTWLLRREGFKGPLFITMPSYSDNMPLFARARA
ncbi:MAG: hypothetical protein ACOX6T_08400 [Myxococcales bacterium]|jgi:hypothetical protein